MENTIIKNQQENNYVQFGAIEAILWAHEFELKHYSSSEVDNLVDYAENEPDFRSRYLKFGKNNPWVEWEMNRVKGIITPSMYQQRPEKHKS